MIAVLPKNYYCDETPGTANAPKPIAPNKYGFMRWDPRATDIVAFYNDLFTFF